MALPVAQIRYALETTEACWKEIASIVDADILTHVTTPASSPFNSKYSINNELLTLAYRVLRPGIISFSYISSHDHDLSLLMATFFDLITMSPYPKTISTDLPQTQPVQFNALDFDQDWYKNSSLEQNKIPHNNIIFRLLWLLCDILRIIRTLPLSLTHTCIQQLKYLATFLWAPLHSSLLILFQFPFYNFDTFYSALLGICPTHPELVLNNITISLKYGQSAYYCELFEKFLMLPLPFLRELHPYQAFHIPSNQRIKVSPQPNSVPACNKHSPNNFFLLLAQYQLLSPLSKDEDPPLLFSGLYLFQNPNSLLIDEFHTTFRQKVFEKRHEVKMLCSKALSTNILPCIIENQMGPAQDESYAKYNNEEDDFMAALPLTSIPDLLPIVGTNLLFPFIFAEAEVDPEDPEMFDKYPLPFSSIDICSDLSFSVAQIWKIIFRLVGQDLPTSRDINFFLAQLFHQFKLLSILKDHIERSILSVYWDGREHFLYQHMKPCINALQNIHKTRLCIANDTQLASLQNICEINDQTGHKISKHFPQKNPAVPTMNDINTTTSAQDTDGTLFNRADMGHHIASNTVSMMTETDYLNQLAEKEFRLGVNLLKFLHPLTSDLIPHNDLNSQLLSNSLDDDSILDQGIISENIYNLAIKPTFYSKKHQNKVMQQWRRKNLTDDVSPLFAPVTSTGNPFLSCVPFDGRNKLAWQLFSGTEFRANDLWRTLAWPLYAYFQLTTAYSEFFIWHGDHMTDFLLHYKGKSDAQDKSDANSEEEKNRADDTKSKSELVAYLIATSMPNPSDSLFMPDDIKLKLAITPGQRCQYKDRFIIDSIYHIHILLTCYKLNNIPFYSDDMLLFIDINRNSFLQVIDEFLSILCQPGGWVANNTLFSLLFIQPMRCPEQDPNSNSNSINNVDNDTNARLRNMFDPISSIPFHNCDVLKLDYIFKRTGGYSDEQKSKSLTQHIFAPVELNKILDSASNNADSDLTLHPLKSDYYYTPLLDILVDDQLHGLRFCHSSLTVTDHSDLYRQPRAYRASEPHILFLQTLLFRTVDFTAFLVDNRFKQLLQWIFFRKKKFIQLLEFPQLNKHSTQTLATQYPYIPHGLIPAGEWTSNFESLSIICLPIRPKQRNTVSIPPVNHNYYNILSPIFFQTEKPFLLQDLPCTICHHTTTALAEHIGKYNSIKSPICEDLPQACYNNNLTHTTRTTNYTLNQNQHADSIKSQISNLPQKVTTSPSIFTSLSVDTPTQLRQIYQDQFDYINMWYFHTNSIPIFLFRVERFFWIQHIYMLKYRFVRQVLALSQNTGIPINRKIFQSLMAMNDESYEPFSLTQADLASMPPSHRELYALMMSTTDIQSDADSDDEAAQQALLDHQHNSKFATKIYDYQHFFSLLFDDAPISLDDSYEIVTFNNPLLEPCTTCPLISTLCKNDIERAKITQNQSTLDFHPILSNLWRSFSTLSDYQHYIWATMAYHREWANFEDEITFEGFFFTKKDPILSYFHYTIHMLYFSIDIENNLPILQHFLFTVNHYSLHRRYSMLIYPSRVLWNASPHLSNLEFVWYLDHIYRLVLQRCLDVDAFFQQESLIPNDNKKSSPYPTNLYHRDFVAPIIHQHIEFLSCMILGSAGAYITHPYHSDTESLVQALYPSYPQQLLHGWLDDDNNYANTPPFPLEHDGFSLDMDFETTLSIPICSVPELNIGVYSNAIRHHLTNSVEDTEDPKSLGIALRSILLDGKHPILLYFQHISSIPSYAESNYGSILPVNSVIGKKKYQVESIAVDIIDLANTTMITIPSRSPVVSSQPRVMGLTSSNPMSLIDKPMNKKGQREKREKGSDPLEFFQPVFTEQYSFQIQYCIESFIDLMIVCDQSAMTSVTDTNNANNKDNSTCNNIITSNNYNNANDKSNNQYQLNFSYLAQIFNSINFTAPMNIPTTLVFDSTLPYLPDCFVERNGPGFITPLSEQYYARQSAGAKEPMPSPTSPPPTPIQKVGQYDTPIQIPIPPYCGMIVRKEEPRFGYYQPAIFETSYFQTFHQPQSSNNQFLSSNLRDNLSLNPLLKTFVEYKQPTHPKKLSKADEAMMIHNISININQHRHQIYGSESMLPE